MHCSSTYMKALTIALLIGATTFTTIKEEGEKRAKSDK